MTLDKEDRALLIGLVEMLLNDFPEDIIDGEELERDVRAVQVLEDNGYDDEEMEKALEPLAKSFSRCYAKTLGVFHIRTRSLQTCSLAALEEKELGSMMCFFHMMLSTMKTLDQAKEEAQAKIQDVF